MHFIARQIARPHTTGFFAESNRVIRVVAPHRLRRCLVALVLLAAAPIVTLDWSGSAGAAQLTEFPVPTAASTPWGITVGPDGALWFTEMDANKIGRITTAGSFTEFSLPTANMKPAFITTGPDGNLWFTEQGTTAPNPGGLSRR
jgi:virginiamycin B lyase